MNCTPGHFLNVCGLHNPNSRRQDGFKASSLEGQEIIKLKTEYDRLAKEAKVADSVYPESPCKTCSRKNDRDNPQVKSCWNCGNQL